MRKGLSWSMAAAVGAALLAGRLAAGRRRFGFRDRTVLLTGGSRGLGLELARQLLRQGARVALCARDGEELRRAYEELSRLGRVLTVRCDVTDPPMVERMVQTVRTELGEIDVLINNAGVIQVGPVEVMPVEDYEEAMRVNFWGPLYTTMAVLPRMQELGRGRIINIASIGGKISLPHLLPYSASKFALVGFSQGLRAELSRRGIVVTTVCPGLMRTGSPEHASFRGRHRAEYTWFSIGDSLPLLSMSAGRAARRILAASARGRAELVTAWPVAVVARLAGLFPGLTARLLAGVARLLPPPDGPWSERRSGAQSHSPLSPSLLTVLGQQAARRNNELG